MSGYSQEDSRWCGDIDNFEFSNGHESTQIENNGNYNFNELPEGFYVKANVDGYSQSLRYKVKNLETGQIHQVTENLLPYTFPAGDSAWNLGGGTFQITASLYWRNNANGWICDREVVTITNRGVILA